MTFMDCPYCERNVVNYKPTGKYKVKSTARNVMIIQCQKCSGVFRVTYKGRPLLWDDMTRDEKRSFTVKAWNEERMKK